MIKRVRSTGILQQNIWLEREGILSVLFGLRRNLLTNDPFEYAMPRLEDRKVYNADDGKFIKEITYSEEKVINSIDNLIEYVREEYESII